MHGLNSIAFKALKRASDVRAADQSDGMLLYRGATHWPSWHKDRKD